MSRAVDSGANHTKLLDRIALLVFWVGFIVWAGVFAPFDLSSLDGGLAGGLAVGFVMLTIDSCIDSKQW